jgi:hypothetical protein
LPLSIFSGEVHPIVTGGGVPDYVSHEEGEFNHIDRG